MSLPNQQNLPQANPNNANEMDLQQFLQLTNTATVGYPLDANQLFMASPPSTYNAFGLQALNPMQAAGYMSSPLFYYGLPQTDNSVGYPNSRIAAATSGNLQYAFPTNTGFFLANNAGTNQQLGTSNPIPTPRAMETNPSSKTELTDHNMNSLNFRPGASTAQDVENKLFSELSQQESEASRAGISMMSTPQTAQAYRALRAGLNDSSPPVNFADLTQPGSYHTPRKNSVHTFRKESVTLNDSSGRGSVESTTVLLKPDERAMLNPMKLKKYREELHQELERENPANPKLYLTAKLEAVCAQDEFVSVIDEHLDQLAKKHRQAASDYQLKNVAKQDDGTVVEQKKSEQLMWEVGSLPSSNLSAETPITYSKKIFVGGLPYTLKKKEFAQMFFSRNAEFIQLAQIRAQDDRHTKCINIRELLNDLGDMGCGFAYVVFKEGTDVQNMLSDDSFVSKEDNAYYIHLSTLMPTRFQTSNNKPKKIQLIPWRLGDFTYLDKSLHPNSEVQDQKNMKNSVFIGALHGMITARTLATIMRDLFGPVNYASIDTDKLKYPIGSGRVVFANENDYRKAIKAQFVTVSVKNAFTKVIQIDPYLDTTNCELCPVNTVNPGRYYCRDCCKYYCNFCWYKPDHSNYQNHTPIQRNASDANSAKTARNEPEIQSKRIR